MLISSGEVTERTTDSASAPGYCDVTVTVGGEIVGYCEMGSVGMQMSPAKRTTKLSTPAKSGRLRKNSITSAASNVCVHQVRLAFAPGAGKSSHEPGARSVQPPAFQVGRKAFGVKPRSRSRYA